MKSVGNISVDNSVRILADQQTMSVNDHLNQSGDFSELLKIVKTDTVRDKEAPKEETSEEIKADHKEPVEPDNQVQESRRTDSSDEVQRDVTAHETTQQSNAESESDAVEEGQAQNQLFRVLGQLSQEELLKLAALSEGQANVEISPEILTDTSRFVEFTGKSAAELMAILNGFQQAAQPDVANSLQLQELGLQLQQTEQLLTASTALNNASPVNIQGGLEPLAPQFNLNVQAQAFQPVVQVQQVAPQLTTLNLSDSQQADLVRQIASGYKNQGNKGQMTEIKLYPEELGMVKLKVEVQGNDVRVYFAAEHSSVNELISQNMDQLKAMLMEQEFYLTDSGLFQEHLSDQESQNTDQEGEDYGTDDRPDLQRRPKHGPRMSPLPGRFRATV